MFTSCCILIDTQLYESCSLPRAFPLVGMHCTFSCSLGAFLAVSVGTLELWLAEMASKVLQCVLLTREKGA